MMFETLRPQPEPEPPRRLVHIVDDDDAVRRSLALLLISCGYRAETYDAAETFLDAMDGAQAGCIIVDIRMPGMDGLTMQEELRRRNCGMPVVVVTGHGEIGLAVRAMKGGAVDFVEKPYSDDDMIRAVTEAHGRLEDDRQRLAHVADARERIAVLTTRERDVLRLMVDGRPNKVIGHELGISPRTVEIHRANVMEKLDCRSLPDVVRVAIAADLVAD